MGDTMAKVPTRKEWVSNMKNLDYLYIRAWGRSLHSMPYYVEGEVERARADRAPERAVYKNTDGKWVTLDECTSEETISDIEALVANMRAAAGE